MYQELEQKIQTYLQREEVVSNENTISAYDLIQTIKTPLQELSQIRSLEDLLLEKGDQIFFPPKRTFGTKVSTLFHKVVSVANISKSKRILKMSAFGASPQEQKSTYQIAYLNSSSSENRGSITLAKMYGDSNIAIECDRCGHFSQEQIHTFIKECYNLIMEGFTLYEKYHNFISDNKKYGLCKYMQSFVVDDGFFQLRLEEKGYSLAWTWQLNKDIDPNQFFGRDWYQQESLYSIVEKNEEEFLKRLLVPVSTLPINIQSILPSFKTYQLK